MKPLSIITETVKSILNGHQLTRDETEKLISSQIDLWSFLYGSNLLREQFKGNTIGLCSIINAKSGACVENCKFCAQSIQHQTDVETYPLVSKTEIVKGLKQAKAIGAHGFSIVTSGNKLSKKEIDTICEVVKETTATDNSEPYLCASLGKLNLEQAEQLKKAGLTKCHHNLETSARFFPQICSTHSYQERLTTINNLKQAGLNVCSGGIFGMGETWADRIDLAFTLRELDVDSIPLNFLIPIKGAELENISFLSPIEALKIIALFRYILPQKNIRICAGREKILRDLQSWIFYAGADGMMVGGYLTQQGRAVEEDLQMLKDLGLGFKNNPSTNTQ